MPDASRAVDGVPSRPSWRQSERDVGGFNPDYAPQRSFKDGEEVSPRTKGSVRPDFYQPGTSIEVKNYDVASSSGREGLVRSVSNQAIERAAKLPPGTTQRVVIDVRGQSPPLETADSLVERIVRRSGGAVRPENITFLR
jgi:hypothetical protein